MKYLRRHLSHYSNSPKTERVFWGFYLIALLIGIVIVLGMLVDDSVVIVESIYYRLQRQDYCLTNVH